MCLTKNKIKNKHTKESTEAAKTTLLSQDDEGKKSAEQEHFRMMCSKIKLKKKERAS